MNYRILANASNWSKEELDTDDLTAAILVYAGEVVIKVKCSSRTPKVLHLDWARGNLVHIVGDMPAESTKSGCALRKAVRITLHISEQVRWLRHTLLHKKTPHL
jgi:hypothetical protein